MSIDELNPYQASAADPKPLGPRGSMEYMQAVHYVFESPKWMANLLWGSLCILTTQVIPIVGQLVWMGYQFEIVEDLLSRPPKTGYPDFDVNRLKEYLVRGLWILLVSLVLGLVFAPIMGGIAIAVVLAVLGTAAATGGDEDEAVVGAFKRGETGVEGKCVFCGQYVIKGGTTFRRKSVICSDCADRGEQVENPFSQTAGRR